MIVPPLVQDRQSLDDLDYLLEVCKAARVCFVGGCVRDYISCEVVKDYDIELSGISVAKFRALMRKLGADGVGKSFYVYKWRKFDIALARTERCTGRRHTDFKVAPADSLEQAVQRRDFTINALMIDIRKAELIDLVDGLRDLRERRLRPVNLDTFKEDALRVLRGVQFAARFKLQLCEIKYLRSIDLSHLSDSRISLELSKLINAKWPEIGLYYLYKLGHLSLLLPALKDKEFDIFNVLTNIKKAKRNLFLKQDIKLSIIYAFMFCLNLSAREILKNCPLKNEFKALKNEPLSVKSDLEIAMLATTRRLSDYLFFSFNEPAYKRAKELDLLYKQIPCDFRGCANAADVTKRKEQAAEEYLRILDAKYRFS